MQSTNSSPWRMTVPLLLTVMAAAGWSWYWFYALDIAKAEFAKLRQSEVRLDCAKETWNGFPFRFTVICDAPDFSGGSGRANVSGKAARFSASVRAYNFNHVVAEISAPFTVTQTLAVAPDRPEIPDTMRLSSETAPLRAGILLSSGRLKQLTVRTENWRGQIAASRSGVEIEKAETTADQFAAHWQPPVDGSDPTVSLETQNLGYSGKLGARFGQEALAVEKAGLQIAFVNTALSEELASRAGLRAWQAAKGELAIRHVSFARDGRAAEGKGSIRLDDQGRLEGRLDLLVKGLQDLFDEFVATGRLSSSQATLASTAIGLLSKSQDEKRPGWTGVSVRAKKGRLYFGPFKFATVKPAF